MADEAYLSVSEVELGRVYRKGTRAGSKEIAIEFFDDDEKIGTLKIGRSYVIWKPPYGKKGYKKSIQELSEWLVDEGY